VECDRDRGQHTDRPADRALIDQFWFGDVPMSIHIVTREHRDRGSTSLSIVLLTPVFVVVAFAAFQAAMWSHVRTEARAAARGAAAQVARNGDEPGLVAAGWEAALTANATLRDPDVAIDDRGDIVVVTVTATAPGIIRGTSSAVSVTEALPIEGFRP
jgi:hypothetical protein